MRPFIQIHKYEDDTISYWFTELDEQIADKIEEDLEPCASTGFSTRGEIFSVLNELSELLREVPGWA